MTLPGDHIEYRFTQRDARTVLKRLRKRGLRSPKDHHVAEGQRGAIVALPFALFIFDVIRAETAFALLFVPRDAFASSEATKTAYQAMQRWQLGALR